MNSAASSSDAAASSSSNALAQARPPAVVLRNGGSVSLQTDADLDGSIDSDTPLRCSFCRTLVSASELASYAHNPALALLTCACCIERKRECNNRYSKSPRGKSSIARSRRTHRAAQRASENERRREARRERSGRPTEEAARAAWEERLRGLFADDSDCGGGDKP